MAVNAPKHYAPVVSDGNLFIFFVLFILLLDGSFNYAYLVRVNLLSVRPRVHKYYAELPAQAKFQHKFHIESRIRA